MTIIPENTQIDTPAESRDAQIIALQSWLAATYPATFSPDAPPPLKVGIHADLLTRHPDLDPAILRRALKRHCERRAYQIALARKGACRVDLDGQPAGEVTEEQVEIAHKRLAELKAARKAKDRTKPAKSPAPSTPAPTPAPTPPPPPEQPEPPPAAVPGRPVLRLKRPAGPVVSAAVARKGGRP